MNAASPALPHAPSLAPAFSTPTAAQRAWLAKFAVIFGLGMMFLAHLSGLTFVDPDLFHEMALAREIIALGAMPLADQFAYTTAVYQSVHHDWGTGMVLYAVAMTGGAAGIMLLKYTLTLSIVAGLCYCASRRGASFPTIAMLCVIPIVGGCLGFTTIRAQLFTMAALTALLLIIDADRRGQRRWLLALVPLFIVWLNLHAGFVVGLGLLGMYAIEQALRRQPFWHVIGICGVLSLCTLVNPYGMMYITYLAHGLLLPRPMIVEWRALWHADPWSLFAVYLFSLFIAIYAVYKLGWRQTAGVLLLAISAYAAIRHTRHLSIYFVVWLAYVPGWLEQTRLGEMLRSIWHRRQAWVASAAFAIGALALVQIVPAAPWRMRMPTTAAEEETGRPMYPTGPVEHLQAIDFRGNVMVPFVPGGFVMWKLHPHAKVSLDGRYEVAYQHGILEENEDFYQLKPGWRELLTKYPTDVLLVPRSTPLGKHLSENNEWQRFYRDAAYDMYTRPGLTLPPLDRGNLTLPGIFP